MRLDPGLTLFVLTCLAAVALIVGVTKTISDNRTRRRLAAARVDADIIHALFARNDALEVLRALRWSLLLLATGVALLIISAMPKETPLTASMGVICLFLGGSTLLYYRAVSKALSKEKP